MAPLAPSNVAVAYGNHGNITLEIEWEDAQTTILVSREAIGHRVRDLLGALRILLDEPGGRKDPSTELIVPVASELLAIWKVHLREHGILPPDTPPNVTDSVIGILVRVRTTIDPEGQLIAGWEVLHNTAPPS